MLTSNIVFNIIQYSIQYYLYSSSFGRLTMDDEMMIRIKFIFRKENTIIFCTSWNDCETFNCMTGCVGVDHKLCCVYYCGELQMRDISTCLCGNAFCR